MVVWWWDVDAFTVRRLKRVYFGELLSRTSEDDSLDLASVSISQSSRIVFLDKHWLVAVRRLHSRQERPVVEVDRLGRFCTVHLTVGHQLQHQRLVIQSHQRRHGTIESPGSWSSGDIFVMGGEKRGTRKTHMEQAYKFVKKLWNCEIGQYACVLQVA